MGVGVLNFRQLSTMFEKRKMRNLKVTVNLYVNQKSRGIDILVLLGTEPPARD